MDCNSDSRRVGLKDIQDKEYEVLIELLKVFEKNNLNYTITGGTVLGANYYKDFIPYDDDIDLSMPREDYTRFLSSIYTEMPAEYRVKHYTLDEEFKYTIIRVENTSIDIMEVSDPAQKISHPSIDIAPLDGTPNNPFLRKVFFYKLLFYRSLLSWHYASSINMLKQRSISQKFLIKVLKLSKPVGSKINPQTIKYKIDNNLSKYSIENSLFAGTYMGAYKDKEMIPTEIWGSLKKYPFREIEVNGPEDTECYIKTVYGGFRELSEEEAFSARHYILKSNN
ncbi:LicD family protein [Latilactobacillus sakei]|uniref:LicD family protein n=1 Tax=Latilactobacillus sakei TaxID=1599 RepID=UPI0009774952|nr:LicD family protein [Latilactobacillus sakei]AWZ46829.1 hypothetical protein CXB69_07675 [Latilactobacillus sakei]